MAKLTVNSFIVALMLLLGVTTESGINADEIRCDPPAFPLYGGYEPVKKTYNPGDTVDFFCDQDADIGLQYQWRKCENDGKWTGETPFCDKKAEFLTFFQSSTLYPKSLYGAHKAVNEFNNYCSTTNSGEGQYWMGIFKEPGQVVDVHILLPKGTQSFEVSLLPDTQGICGKQLTKIDFDHTWVVYRCPKKFTELGYEEIGFQIKSLSSVPLRICQVYAHVLTSPTCKDPHLQVKNGRIQLSRKIAKLVCDDGFVRGHKLPYKCIRNAEPVRAHQRPPGVDEGKWDGEKLFCVECPCLNDTESIKDGRCHCAEEDEDENEDCKINKGCLPPGPVLSPLSVKLIPPKKSLTAVYNCLEGYVLKGSAVSTCEENNTWSSNPPVCLNVCEDPPIPTGGAVNYLLPRHVSGLSGSLKWAKLSSTLSIRREQHPAQREDGFLPEGLHRIGEIAKFDCENKYYELIGSKHRRCLGKGEWTGKPPICVPVCGRSDDPRLPSISNGTVSDIGQWPWQAGISRYYPSLYKWHLICGGSLLSERWVVTAAHCLTYKGTTNSIEQEFFRVYLGKHYRDDKKDDDYVLIRTVEEIHIHPDYDQFFLDSDIALIKLSKRVHLNARVRPVCLPSEKTSKKNLIEGKKGVITGWGKTENNSYSEILQQADLLFVSNAVCEKSYYDEWNVSLTVTDNSFCAGHSYGLSRACRGDSGSPFVFLDDSIKDRTWVLEGIVSWGRSSNCTISHKYAGFTTVYKFLDWIYYFL